MIDDQSYSDSWKCQPVPLPDFDEEDYPFILLSGAECLSIINVKEGVHRPLINQTMNVRLWGLTSTFVKKEEYGLSVHWTNSIQNIEGISEETLIQYSYIALKNDVFVWLKENGMIPTTSIS